MFAAIAMKVVSQGRMKDNLNIEDKIGNETMWRCYASESPMEMLCRWVARNEGGKGAKIVWKEKKETCWVKIKA